MNEYFKNKFPFAYNYFNSLLELVKNKQKEFPQALIFEGEDTTGQYLFTLELARELNCQNNGENNCLCTNCKWIRSFTHPCINNVSQIHFKSDDDSSTTVISVKQAREIEKNLSISSDYHRFFIFFSSAKKEIDENSLNDFKTLGYNDKIDFSIEPINLKTFNIATPNALLKSIEEPPKNTTFVFLTNARENIIQTIVSRCQVFKLSGSKKQIDYSQIKNIFSNYPNLNYENALNISDILLDTLKNEDVGIIEILNSLTEFLKDLIILNLDNNILISKIQNDINLTNKAIKMSKASIQDKIVLETLMLQMVRGY